MRRIASDSHRLSILSDEDIDDLYGLPRFTDEDRHLYFGLSLPEREAVDVHTPSVAAHLILQLGYFKAKQQFFNYSLDNVGNDLHHIQARYFPGVRETSLKMPSRPTRFSQHQAILKLFDYHNCDSDAKDKLERKAQRVAMLSTQPLYILRESLKYLENQRTVVPPYTFLQDMVGKVVTHERNRVTRLLSHALTPLLKTQLDALLTADEQVYRINALKREPKDFSYNELRREVGRRKFFEPLYEFARSFLAEAGLSNESGKYYASLVKFYTVYKLQRMPLSTTRLYLLCFAYHRFRQINDNLIEAFIYLVGHYEKQAKQAAFDAVQCALIEAGNNLYAAGTVLALFVDSSIPGHATFASVKEKAFTLLEPEKFPIVSNYMRKIAFDKIGFEWEHYTKLSPTFKRNLRQLFSDLDFAGRVEDAPLLEAIVFLQDLLRQGKSPRQTNPSLFPIKIIPKSVRPYLFSKIKGEKKQLEVDRYEFLVYRLLSNALEAGDVFVKDSLEFRRFEDDLISDIRWQDKDAVLREIGSPILLTPIKDTLVALYNELETKFETVNHRINNNLNEHIKVSGKAGGRRWSLMYPSAEEPVNNPFYGQLPGVGIADLLWFVAGGTGFLGEFVHVLDRYVKNDPDPREILACLVAMGTNMGLWKMAEVSGLGHASLLTTARNYLRLETLHAANDVISNEIAKLPVFNLYNIQDTLHSSSDGQRMETQINTVNARFSPKYFGLQKGVSAYTLVANHVPINAKIIGTHEHESHYVLDLLYNNTSDIKPDRHSTDTHGTNQVNFFCLYTFGYHYAPRYRDLHKRMDGLVGFKQPSEYRNFLIKPARKVYEKLVVDEWPTVQRIMASLAQKDVTQATIIRKLASYARQNKTKKALWELENIFRTLYILDFIDDVNLRQCVQKALNRGEAYHRLRRAVAFVNGGKFRVKTETEQQIWNECSRLITNAIIYYNTVLLSRVYEQKQAAGDQAALSLIEGVSPVAWQNINLFGSFEFNPSGTKIDVDAMVARFADPAYWSRVIKDEQEPSLG
jgi:TnpA family transposase